MATIGAHFEAKCAQNQALDVLQNKNLRLDARRFVKAFRNALMLKPVDNATEFVRNYVLDVRPIQVDRLRRSIELYRELTDRIKQLKLQSAALGQMIRIVVRTNDNEWQIVLGEWRGRGFNGKNSDVK